MIQKIKYAYVTSRAGLTKRGALARFGCNGERGRLAYNGGLRAEPPAGIQGGAPGGGP